MLGGLVFLNLFIGVVTAGMAESMEQQQSESTELFEVEKLMRVKRVALPPPKPKGCCTAETLTSMFSRAAFVWEEQEGGIINAKQLAFYHAAFDGVASDDCEDGLMKIDKADFRWLAKLLLPGEDREVKLEVLTEALDSVRQQRLAETAEDKEEDVEEEEVAVEESDDEDEDDESVLAGGTKGVLMSGYLHKEGHIRHSWHRRWFVLTKESLRYFKKEGGTLLAEVRGCSTCST
jgi:hypothetical protein